MPVDTFLAADGWARARSRGPRASFPAVGSVCLRASSDTHAHRAAADVSDAARFGGARLSGRRPARDGAAAEHVPGEARQQPVWWHRPPLRAAGARGAAHARHEGHLARVRGRAGARRIQHGDVRGDGAPDPHRRAPGRGGKPGARGGAPGAPPRGAPSAAAHASARGPSRRRRTAPAASASSSWRGTAWSAARPPSCRRSRPTPRRCCARRCSRARACSSTTRPCTTGLQTWSSRRARRLPPPPAPRAPKRGVRSGRRGAGVEHGARDVVILAVFPSGLVPR